MAEIPVIRAEGVRKSFGGVEVLHGIDLDAAGGSILALLGENGAGKSTLVKIIAGDHVPDAGKLFVDGHEVHNLDPAGARALGVRMIFQELMDAPTLSVAENICLGQWPTNGLFLDWRAVRKRAAGALDELGAQIDLNRTVGSLRVGERQLVEVARALLGNARCLILDEPTAALSSSESERLFGYLARLRESGVAIIYITHRLEEVRAIADRVQVLRDGVTAVEGQVADYDRPRLVSAMLGGQFAASERSKPPTEAERPKPILRLGDASAERAFSDVSLDLHPGEVLALYGKVGSGNGEVAEALYGMRKLSAGRLELAGEVVSITSPAAAIGRGIGLLPGDRQREGAFMGMSVAENLCVASWSALSRHGWITRAAEGTAYRFWHDRLKVRSRNDPAQPLMTLSGGNQQKVLLGRWLQHRVRVLLLVEPTRGVDVGARQEIYRAIAEVTEQGAAVLLASSDHEEVIQLADRAAVMVRGRLTAHFTNEELNASRLVGAAGARDV